MSVIPLTLVISLCLVFTFVLFFLREHSQQRFSSSERDALLPLADETPRLANAHKSNRAKQNSAAAKPDHVGGCKNGERPACAGCRRELSAELPSTP